MTNPSYCAEHNLRYLRPEWHPYGKTQLIFVFPVDSSLFVFATSLWPPYLNVSTPDLPHLEVTTVWGKSAATLYCHSGDSNLYGHRQYNEASNKMKLFLSCTGVTPDDFWCWRNDYFQGVVDPDMNEGSFVCDTSYDASNRRSSCSESDFDQRRNLSMILNMTP